MDFFSDSDYFTVSGDAVVTTWTRISEERFQQLVGSLTPRMKVVLKEHGGPTCYWRGGAAESVVIEPSSLWCLCVVLKVTEKLKTS